MTRSERRVFRAFVVLLLMEEVLGVYGVCATAWVGECGPCLPDRLELSTKFAPSPQTYASGLDRRTTTVRQALFDIGAHCCNGQIYDLWGRKVFFHWASEWGNPPAGYQNLLRHEDNELTRLRKEGVVIVMWQPRRPI